MAIFQLIGSLTKCCALQSDWPLEEQMGDQPMCSWIIGLRLPDQRGSWEGTSRRTEPIETQTGVNNGLVQIAPGHPGACTVQAESECDELNHPKSGGNLEFWLSALGHAEPLSSLVRRPGGTVLTGAPELELLQLQCSSLPTRGSNEF